MGYYILSIAAFANTFSITEAGKKIAFEYTTALSSEIMENVHAGDRIIGCDTLTKRAKMLFSVDEVKSDSKLLLIKEVDLAYGGDVDDALNKQVEKTTLLEIDENQFKTLYAGMLSKLASETDCKEALVQNDGVEDKYTIEELGSILKEMYTNPEAGSMSTAIHMFGIKYGGIIKEKGYSQADIVSAAGISENYQVELGKGIRIYESIKADEYGIRFYDGEQVNTEKPNIIKNCLEVQRKARTDEEKKKHPLNLIIYGAPGTGKTYSTAEYALAIIGNKDVDKSKKSDDERRKVMSLYKEYINKGQIVFTTFHQNYGYEEFIQGLRPDTKSERMSFKTADGVFKRVADIALNDPINKYVIIIDEINRANISKVFGELITLIEEDKRWGEVNETCATLQSGDVFAVPNNLYIVGTMNSADKSISLIDAALRRRFDFVEQKPDPELVDNKKLKDILTNMNKKLAEELDSTDLLIGHSYFMHKSESELPLVLNNNIIPLLYEYFYDNKKKVASVLDYSIGDIDIEIIDNSLGRLSVKKKED